MFLSCFAFCIPSICLIMGICALYVFLSIVKHFDIPKALHKFLIIINYAATSARKCVQRSHLFIFISKSLCCFLCHAALASWPSILVIRLIYIHQQPNYSGDVQQLITSLCRTQASRDCTLLMTFLKSYTSCPPPTLPHRFSMVKSINSFNKTTKL